MEKNRIGTRQHIIVISNDDDDYGKVKCVVSFNTCPSESYR